MKPKPTCEDCWGTGLILYQKDREKHPITRPCFCKFRERTPTRDETTAIMWNDTQYLGRANKPLRLLKKAERIERRRTLVRADR